MEVKYLNRIVDAELNLALEAFGAVLIEGSKWCGKTSTAKRKSASTIYLQDIKYREKYLETAKFEPGNLLKGDAPLLIDEWQSIPILWDGVRFEVDNRGKSGQFILTGSAVPLDNATMHTGTGRIARLLMRPMSLFESLESNGTVSLSSLFNSENIKGTSPMRLTELAFALARGGWPVSIGKNENIALMYARGYVKSIINSDISRVDGVERNPIRVEKLMRSLARNVSTMVSNKTLIKDIEVGDYSISEKTLISYMNALRRIFVMEDLLAWSPNIRFKIALRTSSKYHFVDPSIAATLIGASPEKLMNDFRTFGLLFESLCIRDLRIYAQSIDGRVYHYHDGSDLEVDAIVQLYDGRWGAIEVKMGDHEIEKAAKNLKKLKEKIDEDKMGEPSFLMILTADGFAYRRDDGVYVVPIGCLKD